MQISSTFVLMCLDGSLAQISVWEQHKEMEEAYLFISNTEYINISIPEGADAGLFPVLYPSFYR